MGGIVEQFKPLLGLSKLGMNYDFNFIVDGINEDSRLEVQVVGYPTKGIYHIRFLKVHGMDSTRHKWWLDYDCLILDLDNVESNGDGSVNVELCPKDSEFCFYLENLKSVWRQPLEEIEITREDIMNNKYFRDAVLPPKPTLLESFFNIFK